MHVAGFVTTNPIPHSPRRAALSRCHMCPSFPFVFWTYFPSGTQYSSLGLLLTLFLFSFFYINWCPKENFYGNYLLYTPLRRWFTFDTPSVSYHFYSYVFSKPCPFADEAFRLFLFLLCTKTRLDKMRSNHQWHLCLPIVPYTRYSHQTINAAYGLRKSVTQLFFDFFWGRCWYGSWGP